MLQEVPKIVKDVRIIIRLIKEVSTLQGYLNGLKFWDIPKELKDRSQEMYKKSSENLDKIIVEFNQEDI